MTTITAEILPGVILPPPSASLAGLLRMPSQRGTTVTAPVTMTMAAIRAKLTANPYPNPTRPIAFLPRQSGMSSPISIRR